MKSVIFIAPPAGGKGTVSVMVKEKYNIPHISTGDLLRGATNANDERANLIKEMQAKGEFVPDSIVLEILKERISQEDCMNGYILDGFPRNIEQANAYENILKELNRDLGVVILLDVDKDLAAKRIANRWSCPTCGAVYNAINPELKPKVEGKCDKCGSDLTHRSDDNEETYEKRYNEYMLKTSPLIDYYKNKGILYVIDASISKDDTFEKVVGILG